MVSDYQQRKQSIISIFLLSLTVVLLMVSGVVFAGGILIASMHAEAELNEKADEQLANLQEILKVPLWNFGDREVKVIGDAYLQNEFVMSLTIRGARGEILYESTKPDLQPLFTREAAINFRDQDIGVVGFAVSDAYLEARKLKFMWSYVATVAMMLMVTLLIGGIFLRRLMTKSFSNFIDLVEEYSNGNMKAFEKGAAYVEFRPLIDVLEKMSTTISSQMDAVKISDARLNAFFEESPLGMVIYDADGRHSMINKTLTKFSGISIEDHIGKTMHELLPQELSDEADAKRLQVMKTGKPITWEFSGVLPNTSMEVQNFLNTFFPIPGPNGKPIGVGGSVIEISELKKAEATLQSMNQELEKRVAERTHDLATEKERAENYLAIAGTMIIALDTEGKVTLINRRGCEVLGYDTEEAIGKKWFEAFIPERDQLDAQKFFRQIIDGKIEPVEYFENTILAKDGSERLVSWYNTYVRDERGDITGTLSAGLDITAQRKTHNAFLQAFELNETIFDNSPVGIAQYDSSGQCVSANRAIGDIINATHEQVLAQNFHEIASWKISGLYDNALKCLSTGERQRCEIRVNTTFKKDVCLDCHLVRLSVNEEQRLLLMFSDITEARQMQEQLIQSSKLAMLGEMATSVAHELNQPLNVIGLAVSNIQQKMSEYPMDSDYLTGKLDKVVSQVERAAAVIDHMRIFGRKSDNEMAPLNPPKMIKTALGLIGEQLRLSSIEVTTEVMETDCLILGHQVQFEQVLLNLLSNARDVLVEKKSGEKRIVIRVAQFNNANEVLIEVEDSGGGIDPDVLPRIFEPFYTTKKVGHGTGLGLSISYGIITDMGGTLEVRNTEDGACFTITLPISKHEKAA